MHVHAHLSLKSPHIHVYFWGYGDFKYYINITQTVVKLGDACEDILAVHALTGCDSTLYPYNVGKCKAINFLKSGNLGLNDFGNVNADVDTLVRVATSFFGKLYG